MISVEEALEKILNEVETLEAETVPILDSLGQVLAEDVAIYPEPCLKVITVEPLPGTIIRNLSDIKGVRKVIIDK